MNRKAPCQPILTYAGRHPRIVAAMFFAVPVLVYQVAYWASLFAMTGPIVVWRGVQGCSQRFVPWPVLIETFPDLCRSEPPDSYVLGLAASGLYLPFALLLVAASGGLGWALGKRLRSLFLRASADPRVALGIAVTIGSVALFGTYWVAAFMATPVFWHEGQPRMFCDASLVPWPSPALTRGPFYGCTPTAPDLYVLWLMATHLYLPVAIAVASLLGFAGWRVAIILFRLRGRKEVLGP